MTTAAVLLLAGAVAAEAASYPPRYRFRSLSSESVTVHYHQGLEAQAREALAIAEELLETQTARYDVKVGRVHIVLADAEDTPNGSATPLPYPLVTVRAVAPDGTDGFGNYDSWLRLALSHELAHIVHLEQVRGIPAFGRKLLGRAPYFFPNGATPTWMIEGVATYEETQATAFGRGRDPDSRMVLRMATLDDRLPIDRAALGLDRWPGGTAPYLFGESFLRDLDDRFGSGTVTELTRVHSGRIIPFLDPLTSHTVTGATFGTRWQEWTRNSGLVFTEEQDALRERGISESRPITQRGIRQLAPRFSPDGEWIAYSSRALTRYGHLRLVRPDGSDDQRLTERNGGTGLSWTPDAATIVYDEPEIHRFFEVRSDLVAVDVATRRRRRLTRGLRARDPDVHPTGESVVFVRRLEDRSELYTVDIDGGNPTRLTHSDSETQWSGPRWSPAGSRIVASRWSDRGHLDIVLVDPVTGAVEELTRDRAKDVEPDWLPDGTHVVFRSDRDGISNLYALRLSDKQVLRLSRVVGGAFFPGVAPDGRELAFSRYGARGYDIHVMDLPLAALDPAEPFEDPYPPSSPRVASASVPDRTYRPLPTLLPRFWTPYFGSISGETRYGAATAGADPLRRHAYGLAIDRGLDTGRMGAQGFYQYDRLFPTLLLTGRSRTEVQDEGLLVENRELTLRASFPVSRSFRRSQAVSIAFRREREDVPAGPDAGSLDFGGIELSWGLSSARRYPYSISLTDGWRLGMSYLREARALGSDVNLGKLSGDARAYVRLSKGSQVLALRVGGGTTFGQPGFTRSFAVGGFPDASLFDLVETNRAVLRGYPDGAFTGRHFAQANAEYRFPLGHPQRGLGTLPFFLRHLHGALFVDAAHAWSNGFRLEDVKTSAGVALGGDAFLFHAVPVTASVGVAKGFGARGESQVYFRFGLAF